MPAERVNAVHTEPVWRERANYILGSSLPEEGRGEQLWARQIDDQRFELCCIPFFLFDIALGDIVEADRENQLVRVVEASGRFVFRVWFGDNPQFRGSVSAELAELGALLEWSSADLLAVDAADAGLAQVVADYLVDPERAGHLLYETGRS